MQDQCGRKIEYIRISVTDKCSFRCVYCMPEEGVPCMEHKDILRFEEILRICRAAVALGIHKVKITGGEPLVRRDICKLIAQLHRIEGIDSITLTTNGYQLKEYLPELKKAGITGINVSLDTLDPLHFQQITRRDGLRQVLEGIQEAIRIGIPSVKVNCVPMEWNRQDISAIALLAQAYPVHVRFIEMMPIGTGAKFSTITQEETFRILTEKIGSLTLTQENLGNGPAVYYKREGFPGRIGFISAVSHEFCGNCNRIRLTADGYLKPCLNYEAHGNLRDYLRNGADDRQLESYMRELIYKKPKHHGFADPLQKEKEMQAMNKIGG